MRQARIRRSIDRLRAHSWSRRKHPFQASVVAFYVFITVIAGVVTLSLNELVAQENIIYNLKHCDIDYLTLRSMKIDSGVYGELRGRYADGEGGSVRMLSGALAVQMMYRDYLDRTAVISDKLMQYCITGLADSGTYEKMTLYIEGILETIKCFPVDVDYDIKGTDIRYEDSWMEQRTYGGNRGHEGTDIMTGMNKSGYYPIVSVSDGVVENMGWLEQGGYRVGIRCDNGVYYYYAHLHSYAENLKKGDRVTAGTVLGLMGDTGYGKKEGTSGKFDVHLHFGIYVKDGEQGDVSVNPYYILRAVEEEGAGGYDADRS